MMRKLFHDFKASLKDISVEEPVDLFLFRPVAFVIVQLIRPLPVTPNQISILSVLAGISGAIFFSRGTPNGFLVGGLCYALAHTLDCCDGMVARLKGSGTLTGRIIDGVADYTSGIAVLIGGAVGIYKAGFHYAIPTWTLLSTAALCMIVHAIVVDYYKSEFMAHGLGMVNSIQEEMERFSREMEKLKQGRGRYIDKLMIWLYLGYSRIQLIRSKEKKEYDRQVYYAKNKLLLHLWMWIGMAAHISVIIMAGIFFKPEIFFYYSLGAANIWMLVLLVIQIRVNKKIVKT